MHACKIPACEMYAHEMIAYDRSCLLELLTYERHTCRRLVSIREIYLRAIYIYERSISTHRCVSHRRVFQSVHLRGVQGDCHEAIPRGWRRPIDPVNASNFTTFRKILENALFSQRLKGEARVKNFTNQTAIRVTRLGIKALGQLHCILWVG